MSWVVTLNGRVLPPDHWRWTSDNEIVLVGLDLEPGVEIETHVDWARRHVSITAPYDVIRALESALDLQS